MPYDSFLAIQGVEETPFRYSSSKDDFAYEISIRTASSIPWLGELQATHRLVQVLLKGELLGQYRLLDFLIWPEGFFTRVSLKGSFSLSEFLALVKEKSASTTDPAEKIWDDELQWIKLVPPEKIRESTENFFKTADLAREELRPSVEFLPHLFFFYRNPRLSK
jgi:hypothetical protein